MKATLYINGTIAQGSDYFGGETFGLYNLVEFLANNKDAKELDVYINSGGGSVNEGFAIYDRLMAFNGTVNTIVNGMCGSIATVIFQAGKKGKRSMYANSEFFVHNPYWQPSAPEPMEAKDLELLSEDLKKAENKIKNFYSEITGKSVDELTPILDRQTTLSTTEAIAFGFVDEVYTSQIEAFTKYKLVAFLNPNNKTTMNTEIKDELSGLKAFMAKIAKKLFKNAMRETVDGVAIHYDGDLLQVDTAVFTDEAMATPLADGTYVLDGDIQITVANGIVTALSEVESKKTIEEELAAKVTELEAKLAEQTQTIEAKEAENVEIVAMFKDLTAKVTKFEAMVVTGNKPEVKGEQHNGKEVSTAPMTAMEKFAEMKRKQKSNK